MSNDIQIFIFNSDHKIRTQLINQEPYFLANDVCNILGYINSRDAISRHVDKNYDVVIRDATDKLGRKQSVNWINESGLYSLIFGSKLPAAIKFKRWVTSEVLPALRKTGTYSLPRQNSHSVGCPLAPQELREDLYTMRCSLMDMRSCKSEEKAAVQGQRAALKLVSQLLSSASAEQVLQDCTAFINNVRLMGNLRDSLRCAFLQAFLETFRASLKEQEQGCQRYELITAHWEEFKELEQGKFGTQEALKSAALGLRRALELQ